MNRVCDIATQSELCDDRYDEYYRLARLLRDDPEISKCHATRAIVDLEWYEQHFDEQPNMKMVCDMDLPQDMLGMVMVRDAIIGDKRCSLFLICVQPFIHGVVKQFTIAHELGHVIMHGALLYAGMVVPERMWNYSKEADERRRLMEIEANIYALLSIVPTPAIQRLQDLTGDRDLMPEVLQEAMTWLRNEPFPLTLARERLILHKVITGSRHVADDFRRHVWNPAASWTMSGAAGMYGVLTAEQTAYQLLSAEQLEAWKTSLSVGR